MVVPSTLERRSEEEQRFLPSKMLRNADISYSSIAHNQQLNSCSCCFCSCSCSLKSCCKCCLLRLPYGTITATLMSVCGLIIAITSLLKSTRIADRLFQDVFLRKHLWFSDLKVIYIIVACLLSVLIVVNLLIGFATTGRDDDKANRKGCRTCGCTKGSATTCVVKSIFVINYLLYHILFFLALVFVISLFICYVVSRLCNDGTTVTVGFDNKQNHYNPAENNKQIDLRQFAPLFSLRSNETERLLFKGPNLKKLCSDYVSGLYFNMILSAIGFVLLCWGFMNYLINLSVNWVRLNTKQKCAEMMYIASEMTPFSDHGLEQQSRY